LIAQKGNMTCFGSQPHRIVQKILLEKKKESNKIACKLELQISSYALQ